MKSVFPYAPMFAAGIGIPVLAALNSQLGLRLGSPWVATVILFLVAVIAAGAALAIAGPPARIIWNAPPIYYFAGLFVVFYVLSVTWAAPRIGVGNAIFLVLLGQIVAAAMIDHFGLFGVARSPLTLQRVAGMALMAAGVFLARRVA